MQTQLIVPESLDGTRLDKAVRELAPELSRARLKEAISQRRVRFLFHWPQIPIEPAKGFLN